MTRTNGNCRVLKPLNNLSYFWLATTLLPKTRGVCAATLEGQAMTSSRRKGKRAELEVAALLRDLLGAAVVRNLTQTRDGGHDLPGCPDGRPRSSAPRGRGSSNGGSRRWIKQTGRNRRSSIALTGGIGVRWWRSRTPGRASRARLVTWTLETSLEVFAALVREGLRPVVEPVEDSRVSVEAAP